MVHLLVHLPTGHGATVWDAGLVLSHFMASLFDFDRGTPRATPPGRHFACCGRFAGRGDGRHPRPPVPDSHEANTDAAATDGDASNDADATTAAEASAAEASAAKASAAEASAAEATAMAAATGAPDVRRPSGRLAGCRVLELGAGTGLVGLVCAAHGAEARGRDGGCDVIWPSVFRLIQRLSFKLRVDDV